MNLPRLALINPVATQVGVLLVILFGAISLSRLPVQLTPEVDTPEITISTVWRAAAPEEIEAEIIEPQEEVLRGIPGMTEMLSQSNRSRGQITIKFAVGMDMGRALLEVLNRLNRVPRYPEDADEPVLSSVGGSSRPIAWFILKTLPGNDRNMASYQDYVEEVIQTRFERIPGVARSEVRGGRKNEIRITFDPYKAASLGVQLPVAARLTGGNEDVSGGFVDVGKRRYTIRFTGSFAASELKEMVIDWRDGRPIYLRDVASVEKRMVDRDSFVITRGEVSMAVNAHREIGVNVLDVMDGLYQAVDELREGPLKRAGLSIEQVYDETTYIYRAVNMVRNNLALGMMLAVAVLWWFLRKFRATLIVAASIPISLFAAFSVLDASGHTLNVISLAGLAFAVGMVLDASIVVLENIARMLEHGHDSESAAEQGPLQVWGALLASTATTVAIFLPVVFLKEEAGQLFGDLALTIAAAVTISLVVAVTVIPAAARRFFHHADMSDPHEKWWDRITQGIMRLTRTANRRKLLIVTLLVVPVTLTLLLLPKTDYLPEGNRNLVFAFILPPPGVNIDVIEKEMGQVIAERLQPYLDGSKEPRIKHYFFVAFQQGVFMGTRTVDPDRAGEMVGIINGAVRGFPDTLAFARRASLFGGFGEGRTIDVNLQGRNLEEVLEAAVVGFQALNREFAPLGRAQVRPFPNLELAEPELRLVPDERRIREAGWNRETMAGVVRALGQGLYVGDRFDGEQRLDIIVRVQPWQTPEELANIPLATPSSGVLPVRELVNIVRTAGPNEIRRLDRRRTVTLQVKPPENVSLEDALKIIKENVQPEIEQVMPTDGTIRYGGTADKLDVALKSMSFSFAIAICILYLLMSALFRSFLDSLLVLVALPLATVGSVLALNLTNMITFQPMDLLTMIGFVILLGLVVNNAILLVHQTRAAEREGMARRDAVEQAVRLRLRPILMSTLTSLFGMLPLLLNPGAGTELYRGMAAVIVGGMSVSTVFTLILLPSLLRIGEDSERHAGTS